MFSVRCDRFLVDRRDRDKILFCRERCRCDYDDYDSEDDYEDCRFIKKLFRRLRDEGEFFYLCKNKREYLRN